jgi:hypothetical protein
MLTLNLRVNAAVATARRFCADKAANLMRGDGPYAGLAIGLASGLPALARSGPSRGSLVKLGAALELTALTVGPVFLAL